MSLKGFHIFFISISVLLSVFFAIWSLKEYTAESDSFYLMVFMLTLLFILSLVVYGRWFLKKIKRIN